MSSEQKTSWHTWVATIAGIIAILAFFGIAVWTDLLPSNSSNAENGDQSQSECKRIADSFPQTLKGIRDEFKLPDNENTFRLLYEKCGTIATGFVFEGSNEFVLDVPDGGCIDSYNGAYFSEIPVDETSGGLRAYSGFVRTTGVTYRTAWCENKP